MKAWIEKGKMTRPAWGGDVSEVEWSEDVTMLVKTIGRQSQPANNLEQLQVEVSVET